MDNLPTHEEIEDAMQYMEYQVYIPRAGNNKTLASRLHDKLDEMWETEGRVDDYEEIAKKYNQYLVDIGGYKEEGLVYHLGEGLREIEDSFRYAPCQPEYDFQEFKTEILRTQKELLANAFNIQMRTLKRMGYK